MEKLDRDLIIKLSKDLMLELSDDEVDNIVEESALYLNYVSHLQAIDCKGVDAMSYPFEEETSWLRDDEESHVIDRERAFLNAPRHDDEYFEIVKVVQK